MSNQFLVEVIPKHFHLLPAKSTTQDLNMKSVKSGSLIHVKHLCQKDGSRFKVIYSKNYDPVDIIHRLKVLFPDSPEVWSETKPQQNTILTITEHCLQGLFPKEDYEYRAYWTHTFLNGKRMIPIIINKPAKTFYNASCLFEQFTPEDDIGVLVDDEKQLVLGEDWFPEVINYHSFIRLCSCCGIVSNISKPKTNPWLSKKHL